MATEPARREVPTSAIEQRPARHRRRHHRKDLTARQRWRRIALYAAVQALGIAVLIMIWRLLTQ